MGKHKVNYSALGAYILVTQLLDFFSKISFVQFGKNMGKHTVTCSALGVYPSTTHIFGRVQKKVPCSLENPWENT